MDTSLAMSHKFGFCFLSFSDKACSGSDRSTFNANLIVLFSEEYARFPKPSPPSYPGAPKGLYSLTERCLILVHRQNNETISVIEFQCLHLVEDSVTVNPC